MNFDFVWKVKTTNAADKSWVTMDILSGQQLECFGTLHGELLRSGRLNLQAGELVGRTG